MTTERIVMEKPLIAIVGGGAAGFFAAITAARLNPAASVIILEKGPRPLVKVGISGGGRCNVTHNCPHPDELVKHYPRGHKELLGPFYHFGPEQMMEWLQMRGIMLKIEADGRVFPASDSSADIIRCLSAEAERAGVELRLRRGVSSLEQVLPAGRPGQDAEVCSDLSDTKPEVDSRTEPAQAPRWRLHLENGETLAARSALLATGGMRVGCPVDGLEQAGIQVVPPVPSLFTFNTRDPLFKELAGVSVQHTSLRWLTDERTHKPGTVEDIPAPNAGGGHTTRRQGSSSMDPGAGTSAGPLLITHTGLSGPAVLKLSAWNAREMAGCDYRFTLFINWLGDVPAEVVIEQFRTMRNRHGKRKVSNGAGYQLPRRLWESLMRKTSIPAQVTWAQLPARTESELAVMVTDCPVSINGKSMNKDEFVTCGGIALPQVDFRTMESKTSPGLFFAGEVLDIDGITGGFNFQAAWTTGFLAGEAMAASVPDV